MDYLTKAIALDPQLAEAHYRLGVIYDRSGESAKAKRELQIHDEIEKSQADAVEEQRREVKQFLVVLQGKPSDADQP
jgi:lipopolysaccharide biosynthesis regulator YciM